MKDFAPISITARSVNILVVHPSVAATSVKELVALARSKPGQLNCATGATGFEPSRGGVLQVARAGGHHAHPLREAGPR